MTTTQIEEDDEVILVELTPTAGVRSVSIAPKDVLEKSHSIKKITNN